MVITEIELREMWHNGREALPTFPPGTRFSPAAQDFIKDHALEIRFDQPAPEPPQIPQLSIASYPLPITSVTLQGDLDVLHALALLVAAEARRYQLPALAGRLDRLAADCQALRAAERMGREPGPLSAAASPRNAPELAPGPTDHAILHWLNLLRAVARQAAAQTSASGQARLAAELEQVSETAADLGRRVRSGELGWTPAMV